MDALVALLDHDGRLVHVNRAWRVLAAEHGAPGHPGSTAEALATGWTSTPDAATIDAGVRAVLDGRAGAFEAEYPCRLPAATRWFAVRATPIAVDGVGAILRHTDVSGRHLAAAEPAGAGDDAAGGLVARRVLEGRLEDLLRAGPVGVVALRVHGPGRRDGVARTAVPAPATPFPAGGGEDAVRGTGSLLGQLVPSPGVAGRYGSDLFVVLLPGADDAELRHTAMVLAAGWRARVGRRAGLDATLGTVAAGPGDHAHEVLERASAEASAAPPGPGFPSAARLGGRGLRDGSPLRRDAGRRSAVAAGRGPASADSGPGATPGRRSS
jgi:hypothetical protein